LFIDFGYFICFKKIFNIDFNIFFFQNLWFLRITKK